MTGHTAQAEHVRERINDIEGLQLTGYTDGEALTRELIDDVQHPVLAPVVRAVLDEIVGPDVNGTLGP